MVKVMRLALQALFGGQNSLSEEGMKRKERTERSLMNNERSCDFLRKLQKVIAEPCLAAPEIFAEESFPDANVVAEYLDCQTESDEVCREYEQVCEESPEVLAEVGCCYEILNKRLEQPINAPKICRRRLYYIAWEDDNVADTKIINLESSEKEGAPGSNFSVSDKNVKKEKKSRNGNYESEIQKTVRRERSFGRKFFQFCVKGSFVAGALGMMCWGWNYFYSGKGSETLQIVSVRDEANEKGNDASVDLDLSSQGNSGKKLNNALVKEEVLPAEVLTACRDEKNNYNLDVTQSPLPEIGKQSPSRQLSITRTKKAGLTIPERNNDVFSKK